MGKKHNNCIRLHKDKLERLSYRCRREFDLARQGKLHKIDLACFNEVLPAVAMEVETGTNFNNPQIKSNAEDLKEFRRLHKDAIIKHIHVSQEVDFDKELKPKPQIPHHIHRVCNLRPLRGVFRR